jgi:multidrug efflux pump subunit AcrB
MNMFDQWLQEQANTTVPDEIYTEECAGATSIPMAPENFHPCVIAWSQQAEESSILSNNGKVQIIFLPFASRVRYDNQYDQLDDEWNLIENWMKDQNRQAPLGVNQGYFSSEDFWWYDTNGQMLQSAYSSAGIALIGAAGIIFLSSRSLVMTFFATLSIGYVLASVTATLVAMGWTLGFLEAINFSILIGVSVDFVIHFSHAYASLPGIVDREVRAKHALIQMGPSILAAAFTTVISAVVMLFTEIIFFQKFALILFFTIVQATLASFVVFLVLCVCFGPSNPTYLVDSVVARCFKQNKEQNEQKDEHSVSMKDETEVAPDAVVW